MARQEYGRGSNSLSVVQFGVLFALGMSLVGCAGEPPKAPPQPTPQAVRGNADRTFEKLKQEERERDTDNQGTAR